MSWIHFVCAQDPNKHRFIFFTDITSTLIYDFHFKETLYTVGRDEDRHRPDIVFGSLDGTVNILWLQLPDIVVTKTNCKIFTSKKIFFFLPFIDKSNFDREVL
jgi:hypothetical protein